MLSTKQLRVRDVFKSRRALEHIERLCGLGNRFVGSDGDHAAADYAQTCFEALGLETRRAPIEVPGFVEQETTLTSNGVRVDAVPAYFCPSTPAGGVTGDIVCVGTGAAEEYEGIDVAGRMVLVREPGLGFGRFWLGTFAAEAARRGALGMIVVHPTPWPYRMSMEAGNSKIADRFLPESIPAVCVGCDAGLDIMQRIGAGQTTAHLAVQTDVSPVQSCFVCGTLRGTHPEAQGLIIEAHRDNGIPPGANDNGSGSGTMFELARVLSSMRFQRDITFISSTAEEGVTQGAWEFIQSNLDFVRSTRAMLNLDMIGVGGRLNLVEVGLWPDCEPVVHPAWLNNLIEDIADELGYDLGRMTAGWGVAEEARYLAEGVPSAWFWKPDDPYYHSSHDTLDKVDGNSLKAVGDIAGATAVALADE